MILASIVVLFVVFFLLLSLRVPVAIGIGLAAAGALLLVMNPLPALTTVAQRMTTGVDSFPLLAIPLFILAGDLMNQGGIARRMIRFAKALAGQLAGGLGYVNVLSAMLLGAVSGSAMAAASAIGSIMTDEMEKEGFSRRESAALNGSASTTGLLIPPSNVMIVYALASGGTASVAALFLAGYIPGILVGLALMLVIALRAKKQGFRAGQRASRRELLVSFGDALLGLSMLFLVVGGIVGGVFTATEAAGIAVVYALGLGMAYREIRVQHLPRLLLGSAKTTAMVMFLVGTSMAMSWIFSYQQLPNQISSLFVEHIQHPFFAFLLINLTLLVVGTFMDMTPAVLIFTPIFLPVVTELGMDPVHFGLVMVLNLCIGLVTPPVGSILFVSSSVAKVPVEQVIRPLMPYLAAMLAVLMLITYWEGLVMWLPRLFGM